MKSAALSGSAARWLLGWVPRSLMAQILGFTALCMVLAVGGLGVYRADAEVQRQRQFVTDQMVTLARSLATVDAHFLLTGETELIERLTLQAATVDGIYLVRVMYPNGQRLAEVVNKNGVWSPRYTLGAALPPTPEQAASDSWIEFRSYAQTRSDILAGKAGTLAAWQRIHEIDNDTTLGWVQVSYRLDTFEAVTQQIQWQSGLSALAAALVTLALLWLWLRPALTRLARATDFAARLDTAMGQSLPVSRQVAEVAALCEALNVVSQRLLEQHTELSNQKAAMDEHAIVSVTDLAGNILYANQRFCDISGYTQAELLGQNHRLLKSGAHENAFYADMWHTISGGRVWHGEIKNRKKDGGFFWVQATIVPLADATGAPYRFIGIRTDITTNKLLEANLADARDRAEAATLAKSQFLANMSHEIRTPMNAILGMLRLLQNTELTRRQHDYATKAEGAAQSLLGLLNDILDFSKMEAGKMVLEERPFRLDKLMRDISVIVAANVGSKPVEVLFDIDPSAPKALLGDAMRLQQVLINLCGNAVKFTQRGEVLVRIGVRQRSDHAAELQFSVRDTGIGIAPDNLERIFEGFSQAEASTTRRFGGTGLGLNISKRLVALMGGKLGVTSELGKGSTFSFTVTLPIGAVTESASAHPKPAQDLRVLVVDDNPTAREILAGMVQSLGWTADLAADGTQALALMRAHLSPGQQPYQAVFVDWQMPGMDGWETVQAMRQIESEQAPPIVVMVTAHGREMLSQRSAQEQAQLHGFLVKPVTASMLHDAVADALSNRLAPRASVPAPQRDLPLAGLRLLVVEDNLINQQVAREMLSHEGAEVVLAENGQLGVDAVCSALEGGRGFDAVLMDIQMPVMDGYTATRVLRQEVGLAQLPIIAMTANAMASDREACLAAGMNEHIGKPFQIADLVRLLRAMTKQAQPPTAPVQPKLPVSAPPEPALPPVDAVDVDGALERLGGNRALFHKVLASYLAELAGQPAALEQALAQADLTPAVRLLHTLKGLSATVGASFMAAVARQAETAVKAVQAGPSPQADATQLNRTALVAQVRAAVLATQGVLNQVMQSLEGNTAPAAHPATAGQIASTAAAEADEWAQLRLLQVLLASADMQALEAFEALEAQARSIPPDALEALRQAMAVFDFASAAQVCEALLQGQVRQN